MTYVPSKCYILESIRAAETLGFIHKNSLHKHA